MLRTTLTRLGTIGFIALASAASSANRAQADDRGRVDLNRFHPAADGDGFLGIQGTKTPGPFDVTLNLTLGYDWRALRFAAGGETSEILEHRLRGNLGFQVGFFGRLALTADLPFVLFQAGDETAGMPGAASAAVGDPWIRARYRVFGESSAIKRDRNEGPGIAIELGTSLPIGFEESYAGEKNTRIEANVLGSFHILGFGVGAVLGYRHRFEHVELAQARFRDEWTLGVGLQAPLIFVRDAYGLLEVRTTTDGWAPFGEKATSSVQLDLGARFFVGDVATTITIGSGFGGAIGDPALSVNVGATWSPRAHDADGDGIPDGSDQCVHLPEDRDGFEDEDGCSDLDNDNDTIPDDEDRCPLVEAPEGQDEDMDGCTDEAAPAQAQTEADPTNAGPDPNAPADATEAAATSSTPPDAASPPPSVPSE